MRYALLLVPLLTGAPALGQVPCGGPFDAFTRAMAAEAVRQGHPPAVVERFFAGVRQDQKVLGADRAQGIFQMPFTQFARRLISQNRLDNGHRNAQRYASVFTEIRERWGIPQGVLLAFWAFETDFGAVQGDFNTVDALVTLAHDCRRPELFQPQVLSALTLATRGDLDPRRTTGAWAGEIGMVQMLPGDILENGIDGDGDGHVTLKTSAPDAVMSAAKMLAGLGWRPNEPWLQEVVLPEDLDWSRTGLDHPRPVSEWSRAGVAARSGTLGAADLTAALLLPEGRNGPAFLAYPNFEVLFEWNRSFVYVTTAAYFATRIEGAPVFDAGSPSPGLLAEEITRLQKRLQALGHDVGGADGILGRQTRAAVQAEQERLGLPADAWPTRELLERL